MADKFDIEEVRNFIINNGGRVRNHELVTYFKAFLNDPQNKGPNREKFKDYVNDLATIKVEEGEKILVLKKKHQGKGKPLQHNLSADNVRAQSEPPSQPLGGQVGEDDVDGSGMSKVRSEGNLESADTRGSIKSVSSTGSAPSASTASLYSAESHMSQESRGSSQEPPESMEDEQNVSLSVKERAKHINRIESESDVTNVTLRKKDPKSHSGSRDSGDTDDDHSSISTYIALEPIEKEWLVTCAKSEYHEMNRLLSKKPGLARLKNFTNTALHWAAKHGKPEVIKMLAAKNINVNQRTGYTALHLAALHGHEDIIELLVQSYKADPNIRDYSGKKAKQYLKYSASTRAQQLLLSRKLTSSAGSSHSLDDSFLRSTSFRKSNRAKAISVLIAASQGVARTPSLHSSWDAGSSSEDIHQVTPPGSQGSSPSSRRKGSFSGSQDQFLMPPPSMAGRVRKSSSRSSSHENLSSSGSSVPRSGSEPSMV